LNIGVASSTSAVGEALTDSAGANGTDWTLAAVTAGALGVAFSLEYQASNVTDLDVHIDSFLIGTALGSGLGLWEGFAA
jgi:hypothetical protein